MRRLKDQVTYTVWSKMMCRCSNKNRKDYHIYGGRGISVCKEWDSYEVFRDWALTNGFKKYKLGTPRNEKLFLDRINRDGNYGPSNCRFLPINDIAPKWWRL